MKILIVDDDDDFRSLIASTLQRDGHETRELNDGSDVVDALNTFDTDVLITDIFMPTVDGIETILSARNHDQNLWIVAVSGNEQYLGVSLKLGANVSLEKPFTKADLISSLGTGVSASNAECN